MKTVDRLMLRSYLGPMGMALAIVMFVMLMNFLWLYIDDLVGKGLQPGVVLELIGYTLITLVPMCLPISAMLGAIMTMGNLGENYELLALKSAGMSLMRILRPLTIVTVMIAIVSFFIANNLVPMAFQKSRALMYDITNQKQVLEFKDGIFFTDIEGMTIRVGSQTGEDKLLRDVLIYDNTDPSRNGTMSTVLADSGYIKLSDDKRHMVVTLFNGVMYETNRNTARNAWYEDSKLSRNFFTEQYIVNSLEGYALERTDEDMFTSGKTKKISTLQKDIDSLRVIVNKNVTQASQPLFDDHIFQYDRTLMVDSLRAESPHINPAQLIDSLPGLDLREKQKLWRSAYNAAQNSRRFTWDEKQLKDSLNDLYVHQIGWHEKVSLPVSIIIFFLIGAALGAIIRKGGVGMPGVVSVIFFVIYYMVNISGNKMAREGTLTAFQGTWLSTFILLPVAIFLIYKATNDSNLFNPEWYIYRYRDIKKFVKRIIRNDTAKQRA